MNQVLSSIPQGFKARSFGQGFVGVNGPLYTRFYESKLQLGFQVEERHCNPMGICHGGMLATFADMLCPITAHATCEAAKSRFLPTISLQLDYLGSAAKGSWVQGEGEVLRATRNMIFMQGLITADATLIARVSGVFKIGAVFDSAQFHGRPA